MAADAEVPPAWRISIATIERSGAFSDFRGYERTIVALDGDVRLTIDGIEVGLKRFDPFDFRGESKVECTVSAIAHDFNVMTLRSEYAHDVEIVRAPARFVVDDDEIVFAYAMTGRAHVAGVDIASGETAYLDGIESFDVTPADGGAVCLVRITPL